MTAETADQASPGEASFQLLAEHLPNLVIFAFDADLRIWAATGGGIRARGWTTLDGRLEPVVETALFRVAQQALANVVEHAPATHAEVAIERTGKGVLLRVSDDGCGFDPDYVQVVADIAHFGLIAMRERVEALGGRFRVTTAPGHGTVVEARLPLTVGADGPGA